MALSRSQCLRLDHVPSPQNFPKRTLKQKPQPPKPRKLSARRLPLPWIFAGTVFFFYASYHASSVYVQLKRPAPEFINGERVDLTEVYNKTAPGFDYENDSIEYWWGIMKLRRRMVRQAHGHVLESAVGTGRNLEFYDQSRIKSLLMIDKSQAMLAVCRKKWMEVKDGDRWNGRVHFVVGDLEGDTVRRDVVPMVGEKRLAGGFDTIIQTMGLCSTDDPDKLLKNLGLLVKEDGKIMLLEHGKSHYDWLNRILDMNSPQHAAKHGCWWNRDIGEIVERSGLEVVKMSRHQLGTTWCVELKRKKGSAAESTSTISTQKPIPVTANPSLPKPWWQFWG